MANNLQVSTQQGLAAIHANHATCGNRRRFEENDADACKQEQMFFALFEILLACR